MNRLLFRMFVRAVCASSVASAAAETVTCPAVFPMNALQFAAPADGWTAEPGQRAPRLIGFGLYSGPPAELAELQETTVSKGQSIWKLAPPYPGGLWVQCVYADGALTLARRLSITEGVCRAPDKLARDGKPQPVSFVCK